MLEKMKFYMYTLAEWPSAPGATTDKVAQHENSPILATAYSITAHWMQPVDAF